MRVGMPLPEETVHLADGTSYTLVFYRKLWSSYSNELEIRSEDGSTWQRFRGPHPLNIWKVCQGDVEGDGEPEIALGVYKKSPHHPVMAKRVFLYNLREGELQAKYRASRLSLPMEDFILYDIDGDGREEIVAVERKDAEYFVSAYHYVHFSLSRDYVSSPLAQLPEFSREHPGMVVYEGEARPLGVDGKEVIWP